MAGMHKSLLTRKYFAILSSSLHVISSWLALLGWIHTKRSADRLLEAIILAIAELGELCRAYWQYGKRMASGSTTSEGLLPTLKMAGRYKPGWMLSSRKTTKHTTSLLLPDIDHPTTYDTYPHWTTFALSP
jgi:hypothetical protein